MSTRLSVLVLWNTGPPAWPESRSGYCALLFTDGLNGEPSRFSTKQTSPQSPDSHATGVGNNHRDLEVGGLKLNVDEPPSCNPRLWIAGPFEGAAYLPA